MNEEQTNEILEEQEVDYKAEYEKIMAEKERKEILNNFSNKLKSKNYVFDPIEMSNKLKDIDNETINKFSELTELMWDVNPVYTYIPQSGNTSGVTGRVTFEDEIERNKEEK